MDTPGLDVESVTGMVGGGAQVVVFTTGLGTPTGNPDRAGDQDHRQRPHRAADGRQHRPRRQRHHGRHRNARRGRRPAVRRGARRRLRAADRPPNGSATASSRFTAAIPRSDRRSGEPDAEQPRSDRAVSRRAAASPERSAAIAGSSARCCSSPRPSTTSIGRSSASSSRRCRRSSAGPRSTTPTSSSRSSSPTRSGCCSPAGMMDRLGARRGFTLAIVVWSLAAMAHAEATRVRPGGGGDPRRWSG